MHFFRSLKIKHAIAFGIGAAVGVLYLMSAIAANADTVAGVSIAGNGTTVVRGAVVTQITGNEITAQTSWGSAKITWKVIVSGTTRFAPARNNKEALSSIVKKGEVIGFSGQMNANSAIPAVTATMVRNESVLQSAVILDGNVLETTDDSLLIQTDSGTSTVRIGTGTIMTKDGNRAQLADLIPGETVKAFGTLNTRSQMLTAERVISASLPEIPNTGAETTKSGFMATLATWWRIGSAVLSIR